MLHHNDIRVYYNKYCILYTKKHLYVVQRIHQKSDFHSNRSVQSKSHKLCLQQIHLNFSCYMNWNAMQNQADKVPRSELRTSKVPFRKYHFKLTSSNLPFIQSNSVYKTMAYLVVYISGQIASISIYATMRYSSV